MIRVIQNTNSFAQAILVASCIALPVALVGCGGETSQPVVQLETGPLTVEDWKALPADIKFEGDTMDRLRMGDKKWQNERLWQHFVKKVVIPAHQTEVPKVGRDGSILANK